MKRNAILILAAIIFGLALQNINAQISVTVGNTNNPNINSEIDYPAPYGRYYESTRQQFLIRASEITSAGGEAGTIKSIAFDVQRALLGDILSGYTIKMKQTTQTTLTSFDNTNLTTVYTAATYSPFLRWNTHNFQTDFVWDGVSNIIVDVCNGISSTAPTNFNASTSYSAYSYNCYVYRGSNSGNQCGSTIVTGNLRNKPNVRFSIQVPAATCATVNYPANSEENVTAYTHLSWKSSGNILDYSVYFGTNPNPPLVTTTTSTSYNPGTLLPNTQYYWKIRPRNISGSPSDCPVWTFTTSSGLPECSTITSPIAYSTNNLVNPQIRWQSVQNAIRYNIYLGTEPNPPLVRTVTSTQYLSTTVTQANTTYYLRVEPESIFGANSNCETIQFTTASYCPENLLPENNQTDVLSYQLLSWSSVAGAIKYYIYFGKTGNIELIDSVTTNQYFITDLDLNTQYFWAIQAKTDITMSEMCDIWTFHTIENGNHWFVKADGNDNNSGLSWDEAKQDLAKVMYAAVCSDSIHVAAGIYLPSIDTLNNANLADERRFTFPLRAGVKILGGYPANAAGADKESSLVVPRDYLNNVTVLSGDIGISNDNTDNCYRVITMLSANYGTTLLHGLTITKGMNTHYYTETHGAAIYANNKNLRIESCMLTQNNNSYGGAIYLNRCNLHIENSVFTNQTGGTVIYANLSNIFINKSCFVNNTAGIEVRESVLECKNSTLWFNGTSDIKMPIVNSGNNIATNVKLIDCTVNNVSKSAATTLIFSCYNSFVRGMSFSNLDKYYNSIVGNNSDQQKYYDSNGYSPLGYLPSWRLWLDEPADNGGNTMTCKLLHSTTRNPAIGTGNPEFSTSAYDQRGVLRQNPPCIGAYEAPYATNANIIINDTAICAGGSITLNVTSNIENPVFKWYSDSSLTNLVNTGETFEPASLSGITRYYITVENDIVFPNPISQAKKVIIYAGDMPVITSNIESEDVCLSSDVSLKIDALGNELTYQWHKDNIMLDGKTDNILVINDFSINNVGLYHCNVTSSCGGTINSNTAEIVIRTYPEILLQPENSIEILGENTNFSINCSGDSLIYEWQIYSDSEWMSLINNDIYTGCNNEDLQINGIMKELNTSIYRCKISGVCGSIIYSDNVELSVVLPPQIVTNPVDSSVCPQESASFSVIAEGSELLYRWQMYISEGFVDLTDNDIYYGSSENVLNVVLPNQDVSETIYRCKIYNIADTIYSEPVSLFIHEIAPVPDIVNLLDIIAECSVTITEYPTATDNCAGLITATTTTLFPITEQGTTVITWVYDDGNGNISSQTQNIINNSTSIDIYETSGIQIYPNPVNDILNIKFNDEIANKIEIFDNTGKLIILKTTINNHERIHLSDWAKGIYFIHIQTNKGMVSIKFIK